MFADLSSRAATPVDAQSLTLGSANTVYPGVYYSAQSFTLGSRAVLTFDGLGNDDSHFIMSAAGVLYAAPDSVMLLRNGAKVRRDWETPQLAPCHMLWVARRPAMSFGFLQTIRSLKPTPRS